MHFKLINYKPLISHILRTAEAAASTSHLAIPHRPFCLTTSSHSPAHGRSNSSKALRELFLDFFASQHGHQRVPSSPVLAKHGRFNQCDFICSGVQQVRVQFVPVLLGECQPPARRVVNSQKCIRLVDKELVGRDNQHHSFFEMLGNWSFGDYHKEEACRFAWQFLTDVLGIDPTRLYITYFGGDEQFEADTECREIWRRIGIPDHRLLPFGADSNFWRLGPIGPCGTCTEIHVDWRGEDERGQGDAARLVNADDPNLVELWNIVFMRHFCHPDGTLTPLTIENIVDTGMGFERLCALMQGCPSAYETDLFQPLIERISELSPRKPVYLGRLGSSDADGTDTAFRLVSDHIRTVVVTLAEGFPIESNKKYARKVKDLFKSAALSAHERLGMRRGGLAELVPLVIAQLGTAHPELKRAEPVVMAKVGEEEARLWTQRDQGMERLESVFKKLGKRCTVFPGKFAFEAVHRYRLELELIQEMAGQRGMQLDVEEFSRLAERKKHGAERGERQGQKDDDERMELEGKSNESAL